MNEVNKQLFTCSDLYNEGKAGSVKSLNHLIVLPLIHSASHITFLLPMQAYPLRGQWLVLSVSCKHNFHHSPQSPEYCSLVPSLSNPKIFFHTPSNKYFGVGKAGDKAVSIAHALTVSWFYVHHVRMSYLKFFIHRERVPVNCNYMITLLTNIWRKVTGEQRLRTHTCTACFPIVGYTH